MNTLYKGLGLMFSLIGVGAFIYLAALDIKIIE